MVENGVFLWEQPLVHSASWFASTRAAGIPAAVGTSLQQKHDVFAGPGLFDWAHIFPHYEREKQGRQKSVYRTPETASWVWALHLQGAENFAFLKEIIFYEYGRCCDQLYTAVGQRGCLHQAQQADVHSRDALRTKDQPRLKCEARGSLQTFHRLSSDPMRAHKTTILKPSFLQIRLFLPDLKLWVFTLQVTVLWLLRRFLFSLGSFLCDQVSQIKSVFITQGPKDSERHSYTFLLM